MAEPETITVRELIELLQQQNPDNYIYADKDGWCKIIDVGYEGSGPRVFLDVLYPSIYMEIRDGKLG